MSNVHEAITKHSKKQHEIVKEFLELDEMREIFIEQAITSAIEKRSFSVEAINGVTRKINELAKKGIIPLRKIVTEEMVLEYATKLQKKD